MCELAKGAINAGSDRCHPATRPASQAKMSATARMRPPWRPLLLVAALALLSQARPSSSADSTPTPRSGPAGSLTYANLSDYNAWLQARAAADRQQVAAARPAPPSQHRPATVGGGYAIEVTPPPPPTPLDTLAAANRSARLSAGAAVNYDDQAGGAGEPLEGAEEAEEADERLLVSNTCERDFMQVELRTSRPFYGVVHTLNHRRKLVCTSEGDGGTRLRLAISHALNPSDPQHCGVARLAAKSAGGGELLSVIVAVRPHRNIELSEDRFFALNCTNRCRRPDCASGQGRLAVSGAQETARKLGGLRQLEREQTTSGDELLGDLLQSAGRGTYLAAGDKLARNQRDCSSSALWTHSGWPLALLLGLALVLAAVLVSNCLICLALRRRARAKQRRALEEGARKLEEPARRRAARRKSRQIEYDNSEALGHYQRQAEFVELPLEAGQPPLSAQRDEAHQVKRSHHHHHHSNSNGNANTSRHGVYLLSKQHT